MRKIYLLVLSLQSAFLESAYMHKVNRMSDLESRDKIGPVVQTEHLSLLKSICTYYIAMVQT